MESDEENEHESEQEKLNSDDGNAMESKQEKQNSAVSARTNNARKQVKEALKTLQWTQTALSSKLGISQGKISQWLNKHAVAEPETILTQMISFLEAEKMNIRTKTNTGSSAEHPRQAKRKTVAPIAQNTSLNWPQFNYPKQTRLPHHHRRWLQHRTHRW